MIARAEVVYFAAVADSEADGTMRQDSDQPGPPDTDCCD